MATTEADITEQLCQFTKQFADGYYCLVLLRFFGRHPYAHFSEQAVVHTFNSDHNRLYIKRALKQLVDKGVLKVLVGRNISVYSITEDESLRSLASKLAKLDWRRWQLILKQTLPASA